MFINGQWIQAKDQKEFSVSNPANGEVKYGADFLLWFANYNVNPWTASAGAILSIKDRTIRKIV